MKPSLWYQMDLLARRLTPFGLTLILVIVHVVPLHIPGFARIFPMLPLMAIYFWAVNRPDLLPAYAVFLIGVLQDSLAGTPMGVNAVVFLTVHGVVVSQRRFLVGKSFAVAWLGFGLVSAGAAVESWILVSAFNVTLVEPAALMSQYMITLGAFPALAWLFLRWQRAFLGVE